MSGRQNAHPRYVHVLIPRACECYLAAKGEFADVIKNLKMERLPWIIQLGSVITSLIIIWTQEKAGARLRDEETEVGVMCSGRWRKGLKQVARRN